MKEVGAGGNVSAVSAGVNIFHADWTVVVGSVGDTFVRDVLRKAETTGVTVEEFLPSSNPGIEIISAGHTPHHGGSF